MYREYGFLVCEFCKCGNRQLNVHHRTYKRLGMEWLMDVNLLCNDCHLLIHTLPRSGRNNYLFKRTKENKALL